MIHRGIRPIAIGDLIYKVAIKAIRKTSYRSNILLPFQLGVNSPGGVKPAICLLEEVIAGPNKADFQFLTSIDLCNAFNSGDRPSIASSVSTFAPTFNRAATWAYNSPSLLVLADGSSIASLKGVRQGDPLGPLFFSFSFRPTLEELARRLPGATLVAYLDDLYILSKDQGALNIAGEVPEKSPYQLNLAKSKEIAIKDLKDQGLKALSTFIGLLQERRSLVARSPADLPEEPDPYLLSLTVGDGGLGLPLHKELAPGLYQAAKEAARATLEKISFFFYLLSPPPQAKDLGPLAKEVYKEINKKKLETYLQDLPLPYKQIRLENTSYLGRK
ncbi:Uncharacterized protein HZ326_28918 [Fusarium oxysporum f. sp. albedinis]|nr:Uncharacterized protein HZ326_28918 [Fusarium oxysporum f. sp. albedinis]